MTIKQAAKLLDKRIPSWVKLINTKKLVMNSNEFCILGQIGRGDAHRAASFLGIRYNDEAFLTTFYYHTDQKMIAEWKKEIASRRKLK